MSDYYIGEIRMFAGNFAPQGWAFCDGQILPIAQNTALFSILGTTYGGDGKTTFALPNLCGRAPMHFGEGPGRTARELGESSGVAQVTLSTAQMPSHAHQAMGVAKVGGTTNPVGAVWAESPSGRTGQKSLYAASPDVQMAPTALTPMGNNQPHNNMQPYLGVNFIIALYGIYPPRP